MKLKTKPAVLALAAALCFCVGNLLAQDDGGGPGGPGGPGGLGGPGGFGGPGGGNFDPAQFQQQMQQRMLDQTRQTLAVTNDDDWTSIQALVQKVMDAQREARNNGGMGMRMGGPGGGGRGPGGPGGFGPQASDEQQALQKALDDNAPTPQIKAALAKLRAARKAKQSALEAAQENLRAVLTVKQEAQAVLLGLLP